MLKTLSFVLMISLIWPSTVLSQVAYEGYYFRSQNLPGFSNLWTTPPLENGECQGVTHDNDNWYFTWTHDEIGYLIKVPVEVPLDNNVMIDPRVIDISMNDEPVPSGYWHWGDPDHYIDPSGRNFIVVPIRGIESNPPIIAIFRSDLTLAAYGELNQKTSSRCKKTLSRQSSVGWCAINPQSGELYTSEDFDYLSCFPKFCVGGPNSGSPCESSGECPGGNCGQDDCDNQSYRFDYPREILRYEVPWETIPSMGYIGAVPLTPVGQPTELLDADGQFLELYNMQGGEFSPSGDLLYVSCGSGCCAGFGVAGQQYSCDGLHVFNTSNWFEITRSFNHDPDFPRKTLAPYFDFFYPLGCDGTGSWSPEGLTIWDLEDGRSPGVRGQMHVLMFKWHLSGDNRQVFEHYVNRIYVDPIDGEDASSIVILDDDEPLPGGFQRPLKTFGFAYHDFKAWNGCEIVLSHGSYSDTGVFSKRVRLVSRGGTVKIGKQN